MARSLDYYQAVIDSGQFINGLWMGMVLILLALCPDLLDRIMRGVSQQTGLRAMRLRLYEPNRVPFNVDSRITSPRWLGWLGMALILLALYSYFVR